MTINRDKYAIINLSFCEGMTIFMIYYLQALSEYLDWYKELKIIHVISLPNIHFFIFYIKKVKKAKKDK
jgi:hypothetical protein